MRRCSKCNGCWNKEQGLTCDACSFCLDSVRLGGPGRHKKACDYRKCVQTSKGPDVERLVKGKRAEFKAKKLASRGKEKTTRSKTEVGRRVVGKGKGGKKVRIEKGQNSLAGETCGGPTIRARVLARRSTSEWGVGGKKKCSVGDEDVVKKEPMIFVQVVKDEAVEPVQEEYGDSHHTRRKGEVGNRENRASFPESTPSAEDEVMEEDDTVDFLGSAKLAKRNIDQKKASLERMKQKVEFKRILLQDLKSEDLEDEKRKTELQLMLSEIVERQQERNAKAADLQAEIEAGEKVKVDKEEELEKEEAKVKAAFLLFEAAASK